MVLPPSWNVTLLDLRPVCGTGKVLTLSVTENYRELRLGIRHPRCLLHYLQIEVAIPLPKNHQRHWGADTLLREQSKSVEDTRNKTAIRLTKKGKDKEVVAQ